jgi:uncharacterized protein
MKKSFCPVLEIGIEMLIVTSLIASVLTILFVKLSFAVIALRRKNRVALGTGGQEELERAIRAQGNFAEYVPISLILIAALELNGAPWWLVAAPGLTLIIGRVIHAKGINVPPPDFSKRVLGMQFTLVTLISLALLNVGWSLLKLLG